MIKNYSKLIFVCTGNTCRSPMAEAIYHGLVTQSEISILSRGLVVLFPEPANPKVEVVLHNHNLTLENHVATQLQIEEIDADSLILTMTETQKSTVMEDYGFTENVYTVKEFVEEDGDVVDPYGGSILDYEDCFIELSRVIKKTVIKLNEERNEAR